MLKANIKDEGCCLNKRLGFSEVMVWLVINTTTYPRHLWSSKRCTTCFDLQKRQFYKPETKPYQKSNRWITQSSYQECGN